MLIKKESLWIDTFLPIYTICEKFKAERYKSAAPSVFQIRHLSH